MGDKKNKRALGWGTRGRKRMIEEAWSHPAVPLTGLVRNQFYFLLNGRDVSHQVVSELVAYGTGGALSEL